MIDSDKTTSTHYWRKVRKFWSNNSQNATQFGTIERCVQHFLNQLRETQQMLNTRELAPDEGVMELVIPG